MKNLIKNVACNIAAASVNIPVDMNELPFDASSFNLTALFIGLIFSTIGLYVFRRGKSRGNMKVLCLGLILIIYPYFIDGTLLTLGVGSGLCYAAYYYWWD